jgi:hypothetical protein
VGALRRKIDKVSVREMCANGVVCSRVGGGAAGFPALATVRHSNHAADFPHKMCSNLGPIPIPDL